MNNWLVSAVSRLCKETFHSPSHFFIQFVCLTSAKDVALYSWPLGSAYTYILTIILDPGYHLLPFGYFQTCFSVSRNILGSSIHGDEVSCWLKCSMYYSWLYKLILSSTNLELGAGCVQIEIPRALWSV